MGVLLGSAIIAHFPHTVMFTGLNISDDRLEKTQGGFQISYSAHVQENIK